MRVLDVDADAEFLEQQVSEEHIDGFADGPLEGPGCGF